ncbi:hypothetical protein KEC55_25160 [Burkholderia cepacia]|uniref:hypothetical protein n=1 Tax=Burkholderia cepacia TaxID=292 RepID=UPI00249DF922|nr:hypothetical protein [Burkholderia cepacia]WGY70334.1 hypothetical protein KEC55_25160 [Burkholderia cepacia]
MPHVVIRPEMAAGYRVNNSAKTRFELTNRYFVDDAVRGGVAIKERLKLIESWRDG